MAAAALVAAAFFATGCAARDEAPPVPAAHPAFAAVVVEDADITGAWYGSVFGLEVRNDIDLGERGRILLLGAEGGLTVELLQITGSADPVAAIDGVGSRTQIRGPFKAGVFVADVDAVFADVTALGLDADDRVFADEALGLRTFILRDPEGNRIQVFGPD
jgi:hypothetical protein